MWLITYRVSHIDPFFTEVTLKLLVSFRCWVFKKKIIIIIDWHKHADTNQTVGVSWSRAASSTVYVTAVTGFRTPTPSATLLRTLQLGDC